MPPSTNVVPAPAADPAARRDDETQRGADKAGDVRRVRRGEALVPRHLVHRGVPEPPSRRVPEEEDGRPDRADGQAGKGPRATAAVHHLWHCAALRFTR